MHKFETHHILHSSAEAFVNAWYEVEERDIVELDEIIMGIGWAGRVHPACSSRLTAFKVSNDEKTSL